MGLFDGLKMMVEMTSDFIAAAKASGALEDLAEEAIEEYDDVLSPENKALYDKYKELQKKQEGIEDQDEHNAMYEPIEDALIAFMVSVAANPNVPAEFTKKAGNAVAELQKANDAPMDHFKERLMNAATTDEERAEVERIWAESLAEED